MKHPFFVKGDEGKEEKIEIDDKIVQIMAKESMPFIPRNLPKSLKDQLDLPKGNFLKLSLIYIVIYLLSLFLPKINCLEFNFHIGMCT